MYRISEVEMRTFHIWLKNIETGEVKCKVVKVANLLETIPPATSFKDLMFERHSGCWKIMSINDTEFTHDPKLPIM